MQGLPIGVVTRDGELYVGTCEDVGTVGYGRTVEEALENLRIATWRELKAREKAVEPE